MSFKKRNPIEMISPTQGITIISDEYLCLYPEELHGVSIPYNTENRLDITVPYLSNSVDSVQYEKGLYNVSGFSDGGIFKVHTVKHSHLKIPHGFQTPLWKVLNGEEID